MAMKSMVVDWLNPVISPGKPVYIKHSLKGHLLIFHPTSEYLNGQFGLASDTFFYRTRVRSLAMLVSDSLTHSRLVNLIDVTLAYEDAFSKLVKIVADVSDEDQQFVADLEAEAWS